MEKDILQALQTAAINAVTNAIAPTLPIKAVGRTLQVPNDQKYVEFIHIPNNIMGESWGESRTYQGIFRIVLHWPNDNAGVYEPMEVLENIASAFKKGVRLRSGNAAVHIYDVPDFTGPVEVGTELLFPLSLRYRN